MSTLNHLFDLPEQICYVQCGFCTTILMVIMHAVLKFHVLVLISSFSTLQLFCFHFPMLWGVRAGECSMQHFVNGGDSEMRPLHKPPLCQHEESFLGPFPPSSFPYSSWGLCLPFQFSVNYFFIISSSNCWWVHWPTYLLLIWNMLLIHEKKITVFSFSFYKSLFFISTFNKRNNMSLTTHVFISTFC